MHIHWTWMVRAACIAAALLSALSEPRAGGRQNGLLEQGRSRPTTRAMELLGGYGPWRENNDLLGYDLQIRIDPEKKAISGSNTIRFRMLRPDRRIQIDLDQRLAVDRITMEQVELDYQREERAVFIDFSEPLEEGREYSIVFHYSGIPAEGGRGGGGIRFERDPADRHWITTSCELPGASTWWPNKDQWRDEVESVRISVAVPDGLMNVSNGRLVGSEELGDGYTRWDWQVQYPINNYCVSLNIGAYEHFSDRYKDLTLDYYVLPENLEKAQKQFQQVHGTLEAFEHYFGPYPFGRDGFKLIEVPYAGMEHQSAVTYGNGYENGYHGRDWTGVGISDRFDFIIVHETGHEWFGNSVSAADRADMWIQEGWTTYMECLYVEYHWGREDALKYTNAYKSKVTHRRPILAERGLAAYPPPDQYFKGALLLNTLRSIVDDDARWWKLLRDFYEENRYRNILTEDVVSFFNDRIERDLTTVFDQYLKHTAIPVLQLRFDNDGTVHFRWKADVAGFVMPVKVRDSAEANWQLIEPTATWQKMNWPRGRDTFEVATDLYYVDVQVQERLDAAD